MYAHTHTNTHTHTHTHRCRYSERWRRDLCDFWTLTDACNLNIGASSPAVSRDGGSVYVCTNKDYCFALDTANGGKLIWQKLMSGNNYIASPALSPAGHRLYSPSRDTNTLVELSTNTSSVTEPAGETITARNMGQKLWSTPLVTDLGEVYLCLESGQLVRFNTDGREAWRLPAIPANQTTVPNGNGAFCGTFNVRGPTDARMASPAMIPTVPTDTIPRSYRGAVVLTGPDWLLRIINADGQVLRTFCAHPHRVSDVTCAGAVWSKPMFPGQSEKVGSVSVTRDRVLIVPACICICMCSD